MNGKLWSVVLLAGALLVTSIQPVLAAEEKASAKGDKQPAKSAPQLVTESEYARWLVQVLGLSRFLSPTPTDQECFASLLQNGITPKEGWNSTGVVTRATLARTVIQALGKEGEVQNPENDASWIDYLKGIGLDISTIGAAMENLDILDSPMGNQAIVVSTDPLGKNHKIRPTDDQQLGADLATIRQVLAQIPEVPVPPPAPPAPSDRPSQQPPPMTPRDVVREAIRDAIQGSR